MTAQLSTPHCGPASLLLLLLLADAASASLLRVPSEHLTVRDAMAIAVAGDSILVAPGVYTNCDGGPCFPNFVILKAGVALVSEGGREVTEIHMDAGSGSFAMVLGSAVHGVLIDGFTFKCTVSQYKGLVVLSSSNVRVANCDFVDIDPNYPNPSAGAGLFFNGGSNRVENSRFVRCVSAAGSGLTAISTSSTVVEDCNFMECVGTALAFSGATGSMLAVRRSEFRRNATEFGTAALVMTDLASAFIEDNVFIENRGGLGGGAAVGVADSQATVRLRRNLFLRNNSPSSLGAVAWRGNGSIENNSFVGNFFDASDPSEGAALTYLSQPTAMTTLSNNIFANNHGGVAVRVIYSSPATSCNLFWNNPDGDYLNYTPSPTDLFEDPQFCAPEADDFTLRASSPCLPGGTPTCGLIGVFGEGCSTVSFQPSSWGKIKSLYREGKLASKTQRLVLLR